MKNRTSTKKDALILGMAVLIILFVLNFLSARHFIRLDLTKDNEYTLADSTKRLLKGLDDIITVRVYFTKDLPPALFSLKRSVDDVLDEYKTYAKGNFRVEYIDPQESPQQEQTVMMMGIPPLQVNVLEKDKRELTKVYLGMAVLFEDRQEILPAIQTVANLEYQLASAILRVSNEEMPTIAWWSFVPENNLANNGAGYSFIKQMLSKRYVVEDISDENISTDKYKALVLISPRNVSEDQKKSIDKFIVAGGKIVALLDSVDIGQNLRAEPILTGLEDLFANLGIEIQKNVVADRSNSHAAFAGGYVTYHIPYPFWPKVSKDGFDQNDPSVSQLESLVLPWTASFNVKKELPEGVNVDILAKSTEFSSYQSEGEYNFIPDAASMALQGEGGEQALVVKVQGSLNSYFNKDEKSTSSEIILVGNSRLIRDNFIGQFEENAIFFENIIDHLAMGDTLIGIRSRGATDIPIGDISEVVKGFIKFVNIILPPALLLVFGLVGFFMRKQKKHALQLAFK